MASIGYQGVENCYTYKVINQNLHSFHSFGYKNFNEVFCALINNKVDYILVPIENSTGGSIYINYDLFYKYHDKYNINILKEFTFQVNHCLYIHSNSTIDDVEYVLSHPQALAQCINNINDHHWISKISTLLLFFPVRHGCDAMTAKSPHRPLSITRTHLISMNTERFPIEQH